MERATPNPADKNYAEQSGDRSGRRELCWTTQATLAFSAGDNIFRRARSRTRASPNTMRRHGRVSRHGGDPNNISFRFLDL
ncbi:hypothetical protein VTJ04DRAFT_9393 [Mycothermus thermophilus]|uniref:uncharacterized protein n=1 Tax=Humicola insolens TaxID=85995 RepID=UPI0037424338